MFVVLGKDEEETDFIFIEWVNAIKIPKAVHKVSVKLMSPSRHNSEISLLPEDEEEEKKRKI